MSKISVIGAGSVGATVANDLMIQGVASEIVLVDVNKKKAIGEALDIYQGAPFHSPTVISHEYDSVGPAQQGARYVLKGVFGKKLNNGHMIF